MFFPRADCPKRTSEMFKKKLYGSHHKQITPLCLLPIDMVEDFPVGDSLHLIDLGIMKRCLFGWRDGTFGKFKTKWCAKDIIIVSNFLENCKMPSEIHRAVRGLDVLCHWKGSEYHTFLHYLSIVILKDVLPKDAYQHFLKFFCAVTICASKFYFNIIDVAEALLNSYVEQYRDIYGEDYISSNVHNLVHLADEVRRFGPSIGFSSYPFENRLYYIKRLLRNGNLPLSQVAKRISEVIQCEIDLMKNVRSNSGIQFPILKKKDANGCFSRIDFSDFFLSVDTHNKWFLSNDNKIVALQNAQLINNKAVIYGRSVNNLENVFEIPIKSSHLHIYKSENLILEPVKRYLLTNVKCKIVTTKYKNQIVFIPLLHSL